MFFDYALVGGGLQNGLIALALRAQRPTARIALVERDNRLGGNHTWSFHASDVPSQAQALVEPLVTARWSGYDVNFPGLRRGFEGGYASIHSARLDEVLRAQFPRGGELFLEASAAQVSASQVVLEDGRVIEAGVVVDARGPQRALGGQARAAFQKFLGLECRLQRPSPVTRPLLMDATVPQTDGFRFVYVLPFEPQRVLIEDTWFSEGPTLDLAQARAGILAYAAQHGLQVAEIEREESGALPLPLSHAELQGGVGPLRAGYGGGFFHPTTGYSFPVALRLALLLARAGPGPGLEKALGAFNTQHRRQVRFAILLNRLLFEATPPEHRRDVLERFHRLPAAVVERFYALETTPLDRARILCGRPPKGVSIPRALARMVA